MKTKDEINDSAIEQIIENAIEEGKQVYTVRCNKCLKHWDEKETGDIFECPTCGEDFLMDLKGGEIDLEDGEFNQGQHEIFLDEGSFSSYECENCGNEQTTKDKCENCKGTNLKSTNLTQEEIDKIVAGE